MSKQHVFRILAFGIARDITGGSSFEIEIKEGASTAVLRAAILKLYPEFGDLISFSIAVNNEYVKGDLQLSENDEIAVIPPVSGG